jgi:glycosyltransferase involved in cell wall biosynthesis
VDALEERGWAYQSFRYRGWTIPRDDPPESEITYFANDDYRSTLEIIQMMETRRPDLVVTNTIVAPWGAFAAAVVGVPHAWFVREFGDLDHGLAFQIGREKTFQDIALMSQAVFTNSIALRNHIGQYIDTADVQVVYPRVDAHKQRSQAAEKPAVPPFHGELDLTVTVVGRLADSKGQWRAIDAIGILRERGIRVGLCLVGGQERPDYDIELRRRAARLGVADQLVVAGEQANPFPYIEAADVCVTPSGIEAFGRTTLEYMLAGKPVVASALGGSAELVIDGETGYLFHPDDTSALADALERYAADPAVRAAHGTSAESRARDLLEHEFSNASAIERLRRTAAAEPYRLPNIARYWFELPGRYFATSGRGPRITLSFIRTRLRGRIGAIVKRPIAAVRRRNRR